MRHWWSQWWRALIRRRRFERDMTDELRLHLELHEQALVQAGLSPHEAARRARADFGSLAATAEACRQTRRTSGVEDLLRDLRIAVRRLRSAPGFLAAAVCMLALGLGANTFVFAALHGLLLQPLPFADGDRLHWIVSRPAGAPDQDEQVSDTDVKAIVAQARSLTSLAVIGDATLIRETPDRFERWHGLGVSRTLFNVLGVVPAAGAMPSDEQLGATVKPIVLSHERWRRDFSSDPGLIGRTLAFADNKRFTVTGILPAGLQFPFLRSPLSGGNGSGFEPGEQDFWIVTSGDVNDLPGGVVVSRLETAATTQDLKKELAALSMAAPSHGSEVPRRTLAAVSMRDQALGVLKSALPLLQAFGLLVFFIACANLANLLLARASAHRTERAVRLALGGTDRHLRRLALTEAAVIAALGGAAALGVAVAGLSFVSALTGPEQAARIQLNLPTVGVLGVMCLFVVAILSAVPSLVRAKAPLASLLGEAPRGAPPRGLRGLRTLVVIQLALSLVLLAGAGALRASLQRLLAVDSGYRSTHVLTADVLLYVPKSHQRLQEIYGRVRALPGVEAVGVIHSTPLTGKWQIRDGLEIIENGTRRTTAPMTGGFVAFDYFQAMGIDLVDGRYFTDAEPMQPSPRAVIINDLAAKMYFPGRRAVGAQLHLYGASREVVGVVRAIRDVRLDVPPQPQFYQPGFFDGSQMAVRVKGNPAAYVDQVSRTLAASDPRLIVNDVRPLDDIIAERVADRRAAALLVTAFGALAVILAAVGLGGVLHFSAQGRARELGLRSALGASRRHLVGLVAREAGAMFVPGIAAGVVLIACAGGLLRALLFEASVFEPLIFIVAIASLGGVGIVAALVPAWRASRADPLVVLKR